MNKAFTSEASSVDDFSSISSAESKNRSSRSCAECRRSKLRCDRQIPCQSCVRRGCSHLCPDGALPASRGNQVLMARAQRLAEKVGTMSAKIQELETTLARYTGQGDAGQSSSTPASDSLPLGNVDMTWDPTLVGASDALPSCSRSKAKYYDKSAGSEYLEDPLPSDEDSSQRSPVSEGPVRLPTNIVDLANSFPFGLKTPSYDKSLFVPYVPSSERSMELVDLYYRNMAWKIDPIVLDDFMENIVEAIYRPPGNTSLNTLHPHQISVFFVVLAAGALYDNHPSSLALSEQYNTLARAVLGLSSILEGGTCAAVQALFIMVEISAYLDRNVNEERWILMGICCRLAQSIGLHRDSSGWTLPRQEVQRRRILFWELYSFDVWSSIIRGRPPTLNIEHADCSFPDDLNPSIDSSGSTNWGWHAWKFRYAATCLASSVEHIFCIKEPAYSAILELDNRIRVFPSPQIPQPSLQSPDVGYLWSTEPLCAMQQYNLLYIRESHLLYVHRSYFARAIQDNSANPLEHEYGPSVMAVVRSAHRIISLLRSLYSVHSASCSRTWHIWSGLFACCAILGSLVVGSPDCPLAQSALQELDQTILFYDTASGPCRSAETMTVLETLRNRAKSVYSSIHSKVTGSSSSHSDNDSAVPDDLDVLDEVGQVTVAETVDWRSFPLLGGEVDPGHSAQSLGGNPEQGVSFHLPPTSTPLAPSHFGDSSQATYFSYPTHMEPSGRQPYPSITHSGNEPEYLQYHPLPPHQYVGAVSGQDVHASTSSTGVALNRVEIWREFLRQLGLELSF